ncbi:antitoxin HicB [Micrococcaceae sp. AOP34-BR2-30]|uniref:antitoxin HicB n=1 Tax=Brevibacterium aurantiacum TaxID=273384 RepID=UPI003F985383
MTSVAVTARRWTRGWELELDEENVTQVSSLSHAPQQVRDYLDTIRPDISHAEWKINIVFGDSDLAEEITTMKEMTSKAAELQIEAGRKSRAVVRDLRSFGLSVSEVATALDISKGRVSQLEKGQKLAK